MRHLSVPHASRITAASYNEAEESGASLGRLQPHWESFTFGCGSFVIHQCGNANVTRRTANALLRKTNKQKPFIARLEQQMTVTAPPNTSLPIFLEQQYLKNLNKQQLHVDFSSAHLQKPKLLRMWE